MRGWGRAPQTHGEKRRGGEGSTTGFLVKTRDALKFAKRKLQGCRQLRVAKGKALLAEFDGQYALAG